MPNFVAVAEQLVLFALLAALPVVSACSATTTKVPELRYRGDYTVGHEVRSFCPSISSRCYWPGPKTSDAARAALDALMPGSPTEPYQPVCIVIAGRIDTESSRSGFAADYDGLINIGTVYGRCETTSAVTHGDLSHHRWQFDPGLGASGDASQWPLLPILDFGQRLGEGIFVEGNDGCREFTAVAHLEAEQLVFRDLTIGAERCGSNGQAPAFEVTRAATVEIDANRHLLLGDQDTRLSFQQKDWMK